MKKWLWLLVILSVPGLAAAEPRKNDFAYGISIDMPKGAAVAAMSLPAQVYTNAFRSDLGDMRVFNAAGEPVPHMIRYARSRAAEPPWRALTFFPLAEAVKHEAGGYRVHVRTGPDGTIVTVDPSIAALPSASARTYLIDLSRLRSGLAQLRLEWQPMTTNWMAAVTVEASDDLTAWTTVRARSTLSDIRYAGQRLLRNTVTLERTSKHYLRLRQLGAGPAVKLTRIEGRAEMEGRRPIRAVLKIDGKPAADLPGGFEYESPGVFPVDRVNLIFNQANSVADARVESRSGSRLPWIQRTRGIFYRMEMDAASLVGDPLAVTMTMDRHWRVTVDESESTIGRNIPRLEIGYRPHDLFFIARGAGPFTLAYGSSQVEPLKVNAAALFEGIGKQRSNGLERWMAPAGAPIVLGGPQRLVPPPKPLPKRLMVLWSVLLVGVLVVAILAWRLARRMAVGS